MKKMNSTLEMVNAFIANKGITDEDQIQDLYLLALENSTANYHSLYSKMKSAVGKKDDPEVLHIQDLKEVLVDENPKYVDDQYLLVAREVAEEAGIMKMFKEKKDKFNTHFHRNQKLMIEGIDSKFILGTM